MGAWGTGPFDNDDAGDWTYELEEGGVKYIKSTLQTITKAKSADDMEAPDCSNAVAAAEVVAAMRDKGLGDLPDEVSGWLESKPKLPPELVPLAKEAVARVAREGELKELWEDAKDAKAWRASLDDLIKRLS